MSDHPNEEILLQIAEGATPEETAHVSACTACSHEVTVYRELIAATGTSDSWEARPSLELSPELLDLSARLEREATEAEPLIAALLETPERWWQPLRSRPDYQSVGVVRALLAAAIEITRSSPLRGAALCRFASDLAMELRGYPEGLLARVRADALRESAFAQYYLGDFHSAAEITQAAEDALRVLPAPAYDLARVRTMRAIVLSALDRHHDAVPLVEQSVRVFEEHGDHQRALSARTTLAALHLRLGDVKRALALWSSIHDDPALEPGSELAAMVFHNIGICQTRLAQPLLAQRAFNHAIAAYQSLGMPVEKLRAEWALAKLLLSTYLLDEALEQFERLSHLFRDLGMTAESDLVLLDMIETQLILGDTDQAYEIANLVLSHFNEAGLQSSQRARTAVAYLREAALARRATPTLVQSVRAFLGDLSRKPDLIFSPPPF